MFVRELDLDPALLIGRKNPSLKDPDPYGNDIVELFRINIV